jgi:mycobactin lysine-N-oxygenase
MKPSVKHLAIIGGGAKAAAIAARASVINELNEKPEVKITIFEKEAPGAAWSGEHGYTNGTQTLCTPIERDFGYPYSTRPLGAKELIFNQFSWSSYLVSEEGRSLWDWVERGRKPPTHHEFSRYITWAIEKSEAELLNREVVALKPEANQWRIYYKNKNGKSWPSPGLYDGVVVTGPGPALRVQHPTTADGIFDGQNLWKNIELAVKAISKTNGVIAILGAGGTAAAIMAWLVKIGAADRTIYIVSQQPAFYTRGNSFFENRLFNDPDTWGALPDNLREQFANRLNRGVVWESVMDQVSNAKNVEFKYGMAEKILQLKDGQYNVQFRDHEGKTNDLPVSLVFDAIGFDTWWWLKLLDDNFLKFDRNSKEDLRNLALEMDSNLALSGAKWPLPALHAPTLSTFRGPGYQSLMSLGSMAEAILLKHLTLAP